MGIDAPEIDQPYGRQAQKFVKKTLMNLELNLHCDGGFLQKKECKVTLPDGQDVSALLVQSGFAWDNPKTSYGKYKGLQKQAQEAKVGLWADEPEKIISPYCWRTPSDSNCQNPHYQP